MNSLIHIARRKKIVAIIVVGVLLSILSYGYRCVGKEVCGHTAVDQLVRGSANVTLPSGKVIAVEVADTPEARELGLSGRSGLSEDEGLLFVFDAPGNYAFWMKDMKFAIDIIWLDQQGVVVNVENNVTPESYFETNPPKVFINRPAAAYVLELPAGQAAHNGIYLGTQVALEF